MDSDRILTVLKFNLVNKIGKDIFYFFGNKSKRVFESSHYVSRLIQSININTMPNQTFHDFQSPLTCCANQWRTPVEGLMGYAA